MRYASDDHPEIADNIQPQTTGIANDVWLNHEKRYGIEELWRISQLEAPKPVTVKTSRLQLFNVLTPGECKQWIKRFGDEPLTNEMRRDFCAAVIPKLDLYLSSYFRSEYMPLFVRYYRNKPGDDKPYAAGWHCDAGPRKHLKILIYLNPSDESGGNTAFLDYDTTMRFDEAGYLFCPLTERVENLEDLARTNGIPYDPLSWDLNAGQGIVFEPSTIMHKAVWPTIGTRYMVQILFLPSPFHWTVACNLLDLPSESQKWKKFNFTATPVKDEEE